MLPNSIATCFVKELEPCLVCNGANWDPAPAPPVLAQRIHIDDSPAPKVLSPGKGRKRSGGRPLSQAARDKIRATMKGRRWTEEHRRYGNSITHFTHCICLWLLEGDLHVCPPREVPMYQLIPPPSPYSQRQSLAQLILQRLTAHISHAPPFPSLP